MQIRVKKGHENRVQLKIWSLLKM